MRLPCYCLALVISFSAVASADIKIKTRTTVMGHTTESTVYIKGARERNEMSFGGHGGSVSLIQCDQKRMVTVTGNQCMIIPMGGGESACPAMPSARSMARMMAGGQPEAEAPRKGGVVTITRTSTDTGETQEMFGYKARHIKSTMVMESSPDACNQSHMKMETDGWYANLSESFSCGDESYQAMACRGGRGGCSDRIVLKGGGAPLGYPLKQTTTMTSEQGTFTTTTEVIELTKATLEDALFEMPPGCKVMDMSAMMGGAPSATAPAAPQPAAAATPPPKPAAPPAPAVAAKAPGVIRIGVVKIKDMSGTSLPTDNMRLDLMSEITKQQFEAIPLDAESPQADVESEARSKDCDYVLYTVAAQVKDPGAGGIAPLPKGVTLDPAKYQALTAITLYKIGKPQAELNNVPLAADSPQFAVDAVDATFVLESNKVAQQVSDDAHPKAGAKTTKTTAKPAASTKAK